MCQNKVIIDYLELGNSITSWEAIQKFHITRLASRIEELHKKGYNIVSDRVRDGEKHYNRYYLFCK